MVLEYNARSKFDDLMWTVEASNSGKVSTGKLRVHVKFVLTLAWVTT